MSKRIKIVVMSDNHFQNKEVYGIVEKHRADTDYFVHCGDSQWDPSDPFFDGMMAVKGNNDFTPFPEELTFVAGDKKIFVTHGDRQYVHWTGDADNTKGTLELVDYAEQFHPDIIFYGHTHVPEYHMDRGVFVLNPGSTNFPRNYMHRQKTYAVVYIEAGIIQAIFYDADTHEEAK